jgi:hypothetical protein
VERDQEDAPQEKETEPLIILPPMAFEDDASEQCFSEAKARHRVFDKGCCWKCCQGQAYSDLGLCEKCHDELRDG